MFGQQQPPQPQPSTGELLLSGSSSNNNNNSGSNSNNGPSSMSGGGFDLSSSSRPSDGVTIGNGYGNGGIIDPLSESGGAGDGGNNNNVPSLAFDLTDFPSLGGGAGGVNGAGRPSAAVLQQLGMAAAAAAGGGGKNSGGGIGGGSSNLYRLAMSSSSAATAPAPSVRGAGTTTDFSMSTEDFPALPGAPPSSSTTTSALLGGGGGTEGLFDAGGGGARHGSTDGIPGSTTNLHNSSSSNNNGGGGVLGPTSAPTRGSGGVGASGAHASNTANNNNNSTNTISPFPDDGRDHVASANAAAAVFDRRPAAATAAGSALSGDYGLLGLLGVIRMSDADRNALALGSDLTALGLNLNSSDQLYSTFASPWSESPTTREPHYQLPMCYYMQPPALKTGHLSQFHQETLFYIFYALPKDVLQAYAAQELYSREWRYHVDLKLWFKRAGPAETRTGADAVQYIYFDVGSWERRLFTGSIQSITVGLLPEEDVRVQFPNS